MELVRVDANGKTFCSQNVTKKRPKGEKLPVFCTTDFVNGGSAIMQAGIVESDKDVGKAQFQQELNRLFESRGIIADLRSHLRHLMVTALQSTQAGLKPTDRSSPKAQALNLLVAEYLFRHKCHYTLSVFTSEVPTLANFNPETILQSKKPTDVSRNHLRENCFKENEVEEIFNALGMSSREDELTLLKTRYLEKGSGDSLVELFLQAVVEMATKLQIRQNLESYAVGDERLLSKKWSSRVADILLNEKMTQAQTTTLEEAIFRVTENEMRRVVEEERRLQMQVLSEREKRIQEYLKKHENEILDRLAEAEKELTTRKEMINEELAEREEHLTEMAMEWKHKHEEILGLSKNFHNIENENKELQKKLKELKEENLSLRTQLKTHTQTIDDMRGEMNSLTGKLKEVNDSNATLSERIQLLINKENKEAFACQDNANQMTVRPNAEEIPLLWSKNLRLDDDINPVNRSEPKVKSKEFTVKNVIEPHPEQWNITEPAKVHLMSSGDAGPTKLMCDFDSSGDEAVSLSTSSEEIILSARKKLQDLEEETNRINQNYLEYKLKCISADSDSESSKNLSADSPPNNHFEIPIKESKFSQTNMEDTFTKIQKLRETKVIKDSSGGFINKKLEETSHVKSVVRLPTKRQLENRDFFRKSRQLMQVLEKQNVKNLHVSTSLVESRTSTSDEEFTASSTQFSRNLPGKSVSLTPLKITSVYLDKKSEVKQPSAASYRTLLAESSTPFPKSDADCLALLEEARIKSPQISARKPLRQQILLSDSEKTEDGEKIVHSSGSVVGFPKSNSEEKISLGSDSSCVKEIEKRTETKNFFLTNLNKFEN